ncbi:hypothetical protein PV328_012447 [Microctonus aethiopoides]|uniref:Uncharacterized protein n=1 Tax=Microctonus aethiopoides TaxID=144406 RepID=A0AA39FDP9_9HYME|nr:hypothetical protein PV328_012447 [Microctonus aethiopoides]
MDAGMILNRDRRANQARDDRHIREIQDVFEAGRFSIEEFLRASIPMDRREIILFEINVPQYENDNGELGDDNEAPLQDLFDPIGIPDENVEDLGQRPQLRVRMIPLRRRIRQPVVVIPLQNMDIQELEDEVLIDKPAEEEPAEEIPPMYGPYRFDVNENDEPDEIFEIIGQSMNNPVNT